MPYISKEKVAEMRKQLRKEFPNLKLSVTFRNYSTVDVHIMEGDINFINNKGDKYVNHFYIDSDWSNNEPALKVLKRIHEVISKSNRIISEDADYGSIPNYYMNIGVGKWDSPYVYKPTPSPVIGGQEPNYMIKEIK